MEGVLGEIRLFAGNFPPRGWAFCEGQTLPIAQNTALFSLLGTLYGGNGQVTFALPDLRGRVPVGVGQAPGLEAVGLGEQGGQLAGAAAGAKPQVNTLGLHYIICMEGLYPERS